MEKIKQLIPQLKIADVVTIYFYIFLSALNILFMSKIEEWPMLILLNAAIISFILFITYKEMASESKFWYYLRYFYLAPLILVTFKELYRLVRPLRPNDYDWLLIKLDRMLLGADPTQVLFSIANPVLTEILQIAYSLFYFLPIILCVEFMIRKRIVALDYTSFAVVYGFYLSYLGYFIWPAIGPRFTLHNFSTLSNEIPGLFVTEYLREFVNTGESIPSGTINPAMKVQRDVFPSGHTQMTLITMYLAAKFGAKSRTFIIPVGILLIFGTVYLRYHYFIDLVGGLLFMMLTMITARPMFNYWQKKCGKDELTYG